MSHDLLGIYLKDHLAGSVGAIALLGHLADAARAAPARRQQMMALREKIQADQSLLKALLESRRAGPGTFKKAGAWVMEKITRAKLRLTWSKNTALSEVEAWEVLSLGIAGKQGLWELLQAVRPEKELQGHAWADLIASAQTQRAQVEQWRLEAAQRAFASAA